MTNQIFPSNNESVNPTIAVNWQGGQRLITAEEITNADTVDAIVAALPDVPLSLAIGEASLVSHSDEYINDVALLYRKLLSTGRQVTAAGGPGGRTGSLLDVTTGLIGLFAEPRHRTNLIRLACIAATIDQPGAETVALNEVKQNLRSLNIAGYSIVDLKRLAEGFKGFVASQSCTAGQMVGDLWPDAPTPDAIIPEGWEGSADGIFTPSGDFIPAKVVISRVETNVDTNNVYYQLAFNTGDGWHLVTETGSDLMNNRKAIGLADHGLPITSNNSAAIVEYLHLFLNLNRDSLPHGLVTSQLGWVDNGADQHGFLCGNQFIPTFESSPRVTFRGKDTGDQQIAEAISRRGTMEAWREVWGLLQSLPKSLLFLYASFAPALLKWLKTGNYVLSLAGPTSTGKSTVLKIAASVWGNPDMTSACSYIESWDATKVGRELRIGLFSDHPVIFDDTKNAHSESDVSQTVYDVATGRGRTRGTPKGLRQITAARTILLTSGEESIASFTEDGGVRGRMVEVRHPFGEASPEVGNLVRQLDGIVVNNFGHAGPAFVQYITSLQDKDAWKKFFDQKKVHFVSRAGSNHVAARLAPYLASIEVAAQLCHQIFDVEFVYENTVDMLWEELTSESQDADRSATALRFLLDHAVSHRGEFKDGSSSERAPFSGWLGIWRKSVSGQRCLVFFRDKADDVLQTRGFNGLAMRKAWAEKAWILRDQTSPFKKIRDGDSTVNCVVIPQTVIDAINGLGE